MIDLQGKTAIVTGSSSGIGAAIAVSFARLGASVGLHARRNLSGAKQVQDKIAAAGGKAVVLQADFSDEAARDQFVADAWDWRGQVDIWVNNAGGDVLTGEASEWSFLAKLRYLLQTDVEATITLSRAVGERMLEKRAGVILNIGWDQAWQGMAGESGEMFAATKGSIMSFTLSLAQSLAPHVRVNCIAPGWIQTKWGEDASEYWNQRAVAESLMSRWGTPEDIASVASFLASSHASFVNGQVLHVNGGFRHHEEPGQA